MEKNNFTHITNSNGYHIETVSDIKIKDLEKQIHQLTKMVNELYYPFGQKNGKD